VAAAGHPVGKGAGEREDDAAEMAELIQETSEALNRLHSLR
jgi:hypothetical protein